MKKILACMSLVFALSAGATALAVDELNPEQVYTGSDNSLKVTLIGATDKNTVYITKEDDVLFVDQNDSTFYGVEKFFLKGDKLAAGTYTIKMNNAAGNDFVQRTFSISEPSAEDISMGDPFFTSDVRVEGSKRVYDAGYINTVNMTGIKSVAITRTINNVPETLRINFDTTVSGSVQVAIRINGIPEGETISVALSAQDAQDAQ